MFRKISVIILTIISLILMGVPGSAQEYGFDVKVSPAKVELTMNPGETRVLPINLFNKGTSDQALNVSVQDYEVKPDGSAIFIDTDISSNSGGSSYSCSKWLGFDPSQIVFTPGTKATRNFNITVPADAEPGTHNCGILFSQASPEKDMKTGALLQGRIMVMVFITVPGDILRDGEIVTASIDSTYVWPNRELGFLPNKQAMCRLTFRNNGNVHLTVRLKATYSPKFGIGQTGVVDFGEYTILPKSTREFSAELKSPPLFGSYDLYAEASYGPNMDTFDTVKTSASSFHVYPIVPITINFLILILLFYGISTLIRMMRSRNSAFRRAAVGTMVLDGEGEVRVFGEAPVGSEGEPEGETTPEQEERFLRNWLRRLLERDVTHKDRDLQQLEEEEKKRQEEEARRAEEADEADFEDEAEPEPELEEEDATKPEEVEKPEPEKPEASAVIGGKKRISLVYKDD